MSIELDHTTVKKKKGGAIRSTSWTGRAMTQSAVGMKKKDRCRERRLKEEDNNNKTEEEGRKKAVSKRKAWRVKFPSWYSKGEGGNKGERKRGINKTCEKERGGLTISIPHIVKGEVVLLK